MKAILDNSTKVSDYHAQGKLLDGRTFRLRSITPKDKHLLSETMHHLSPSSLYFRFLTPKRELTEKELVYFTEVDFFHHVALLASIADSNEDIPAGVGRYVMNESKDSRTAEIAFAVSDEFQGLGIATILLKHLSDIARASGLTAFTALVLPENKKMLDVFKHSGLPMSTKLNSPGVLNVELSLITA